MVLSRLPEPRRGPTWSANLRYTCSMEQREERVVLGTANDEERAEARDRFRRKLAEAEDRMTPEKRAELRATLGLDAEAA